MHKLAEYFTLASMEHYLLVDPNGRRIVHHAQGAGGLIVTRIVVDGELVLLPPGLTMPFVEMWPEG